MCLTPKTIFIKRKKYAGLMRGEFILNHISPVDFHGNGLIRVDVPCGVCAECVKKKRRSLEVRFMREGQVNPLMFFVTLTYRQNKLPMSVNYFAVDKDTGEETFTKEMAVFSPEFDSTRLGSALDKSRNNLLRGLQTKNNPNGWRFIEETCFEFGNKLFCIRCRPSLCRKDVQLWLKRCRVRYEREFGEKVADFRYYCVGEMGKLADRPHYHIAFFGLPQKQLEYFLQDWRENFGFVYSEKVYARNKDGSNAHLLVGKYVAKYITKGDCEDSCVKIGEAQKPRVMSSKSFGVGLVDDSFKAYLLGFRYFGKYDLNSLRLENGVKLSNEQISFLADYISKLLFLDVNGYRYPLPSLIRRRVFGIYQKSFYKNGNAHEKFVCFSPLYRLAMVVARNRYLATCDREFERCLVDARTKGVSAAFATVNNNKNSLAQAACSALQADNQVKYLNSKL